MLWLLFKKIDSDPLFLFPEHLVFSNTRKFFYRMRGTEEQLPFAFDLEAGEMVISTGYSLAI